ncbi:MAG: aspartate--tRNA ligase [Spirochaetales bacterium]|nr:aspartate--tRNA ligase [Spirochaetales bacterium]
MKRTATCGELNARDDGREVILNGWVHRNRDHGGVTFINLRDRYGITQVVFDDTCPAELKERAASLKMEYCVAVKGKVNKRPDSMINKDMATGEIEILATELEILTTCETLPFMIDGDSEANETLRLKYRYLDLRREKMQKHIALRHKVSHAVREHFESLDFYDIETPTLIKSTPEGARDFLVPARMQPGKFFALPQSPQLYKQILMVSGFDKYYQIAHCYRDEDLRGDRQFEFTQVDFEMSFVSKDDVFEVVEAQMAHIFKKTMNVDLPIPFPRLTYHEAMDSYGSDKPDLRIDMKFHDFSSLVPKAEFGVFKSILAEGGTIKAMVVPGAAPNYSRKKVSELEETAKTYGAKGLAWMKVTADGLDGGIAKFFNPIADEVKELLGAKADDLILFGAGDWQTACTSLGAVRARLAKDLDLVKWDDFRFAWVIDFPLFEWNEDEKKWDPAHHMFSMPQDEFKATMEEKPGDVIGDLYDLVVNGYELASGSVRIHDPEIQKRVFNVVGFPEEEAEERFGFLLESFRYGAPPHAGLAYGLDRLVMLMCGEESLKEVIAFPRMSTGTNPLDESPALVDEEQLDELKIKLIPVEDE